MSFFKFLSPVFDDSHDKKINVKDIPTIFLKLDNVFKGYSDKKNDCCPVFEFKEGLWVKRKSKNDVSWNQSSFIIYIPEAPYYASLRNLSAKYTKIKNAEMIIQTSIDDYYIDIMKYQFKGALIEGVSINHEKEHLELILGCESIILEIKSIDPVTRNVLGKNVSHVDMIKHKVC